jgi:cullin-associated NEDD8-dissociated protein 1
VIVPLKTIASERDLCWMVQKELIRTVDLGPFKHIVDDGLELRKGAFECMDTLLDSCLDQIDPSYFITPFLLSGLSDHYDVKMPCHLILSKLANKCGAAVLAGIQLPAFNF